MPINPLAYAHVRLTVTDIDRSRAFYDAVLGLPVVLEIPPDADEATREHLGFLYGGVLYQLGDAILGLRPVGREAFDEDRTGLDHLSFALPDHASLEAAVTVLEENQVSHGSIKDIGLGWILEFRDPDGIALELFAPKPS